MTEVSTEIDVEELKSAIHGEPVGHRGAFKCDFCEEPIPRDEPVAYDVVRLHDMENLEALTAIPDRWIPDAARCQDCEVDEIFPETDGWEEALVHVAVAESNGVLSLDASSTTITDHSPGDVGEHPPPVPATGLDETGYSLSRWGFVRSFLDVVEIEVPLLTVYRELLAGIEETDE